MAQSKMNLWLNLFLNEGPTYYQNHFSTYRQTIVQKKHQKMEKNFIILRLQLHLHQRILLSFDKTLNEIFNCVSINDNDPKFLKRLHFNFGWCIFKLCQ